jgi:hypothetical protein
MAAQSCAVDGAAAKSTMQAVARRKMRIIFLPRHRLGNLAPRLKPR